MCDYDVCILRPFACLDYILYNTLILFCVNYQVFYSLKISTQYVMNIARVFVYLHDSQKCLLFFSMELS